MTSFLVKKKILLLLLLRRRRHRRIQNESKKKKPNEKVVGEEHLPKTERTGRIPSFISRIEDIRQRILFQVIIFCQYFIGYQVEIFSSNK